MSRSLNHGFEDKCSEETFNEIYNMAFARGENSGIDKGKIKLSAEIMDLINSNNRGGADYYIIDQIKKLCSEYFESEKYCFDGWGSAKTIKAHLTPDECKLLDNILSNSILTDNRPMDFEWFEGKFAGKTAYELYDSGCFTIKTLDKYTGYIEYIAHILLAAEGFDDVGCIIEYTKELYKALHR